MKNLYIKSLALHNYRNLQQYELTADVKPIIIIGANGSGKTNILEAISLIFPGRGLRHAKFEEICSYGQRYWKAKYHLEGKLGTTQIESNFLLDTNKRSILFNGGKIKGNELSKLTNIIWLTPQMDGIFLDSPKIRRKFLDRIVYSFEEDHAGKITKYEHYLQERAKILKEHFNDKLWLKITEERLASLALEIARARISILKSLQEVIDVLVNPFPKANLFLEGEIENHIIDKDDSESIDFILKNFEEARERDQISGKSTFGVHKTEFVVNHAAKNLQAKFCSTGEQKALLIAIILAQINLIIKVSSIKPIILLDEVFVHLDDLRKNYLIQFFKNIDAQVWITATDTRGIEEMLDSAILINL
jgi:DNA replication and repair protein RecF